MVLPLMEEYLIFEIRSLPSPLELFPLSFPVAKDRFWINGPLIALMATLGADLASI